MKFEHSLTGFYSGWSEKQPMHNQMIKRFGVADGGKRNCTMNFTHLPIDSTSLLFKQES
jgi:hypothetical protein